MIWLELTLFHIYKKNLLKYFFSIFSDERAEDWSKDVDERVQYGVDYGKKYGFIKSGQQVICVTGWRQGAGSSNTVRIL